jgi:hypothetical protein
MPVPVSLALFVGLEVKVLLIPLVRLLTVKAFEVEALIEAHQTQPAINMVCTIETTETK